MHASEPPAGLHVFRDQPGGPGASGCLDDKRVPERECVTCLELRGGEDEGDVDQYEPPLAAGVDQIAGLAARGEVGVGPGRTPIPTG